MIRQAISPRLAIRIRLNMGYLLATEGRGPPGTWRTIYRFRRTAKRNGGNGLCDRNPLRGQI
jgi:hypothetical protein